MVMRASDKNDSDLKEACLYTGWKLVTSLARELEYLQTLSPDTEVIERIFAIHNLQDLTAQDLKNLVGD